MNALSSWEKQTTALQNAVAAHSAPEAALAEYLRAMDAARSETMAAQPDDSLRQEAGILFEQAKQAAQILTAVVPPDDFPRPARKKTTVLSVAGMAAAFLACAASLLQGQWLAAGLSLAAALSMLLPVLKDGAQTAAKPSRAVIDANRLAAAGGAMARRIDGYLGDFAALNRQIAGNAGACDPAALALCQELWESRGEGPDADNLIADKAIEYLLEKNGCEMRLYDGAHSRDFSTLPSRSENRTIRPAIVERGTGALVLRGLAAVREENA